MRNHLKNDHSTKETSQDDLDIENLNEDYDEEDYFLDENTLNKRIKNASTKAERLLLRLIVIQQELFQAQSIAITTDGWTSVKNYSYLGITCHFLNDNSQFFSRTLDIIHLPGSHNKENLANCISNFLNNWSITTKIIAYVSDNGKNMSNIKHFLNESLRNYQPNSGEIFHLRCVAHLINLVVKNIFPEILSDKQKGAGVKQNRLIQDVQTRWNSTF
ncbi:unnamed protein product [Brachionus calyciflorus]|uniref:Uncharacterized protein n=1 Tax=Brachionus calyciflorus TaxID=104777 RepID=A0A814C8G0_9BILA|nr:unnamed protein product [Brachionus calyciflorus]